MDPIELRIGNWYRSVKFDKPVQLTAQDIAELVRLADGANISCYISTMFEPLELIEQWLKDFGFMDDGSKRFTTDSLKIITHAMVSFESFTKSWHLYLGHHAIHVEFQYVHQLQNLYFALTDEELIKK